MIRPTDPIPSIISFGPSYGSTDLVLLDESLAVIPRSEEGATGIIGMITTQSATHYLDNEAASRHMFRPWSGNDTLLYTDDIGCMQADGTIVICGRSSRNVKINGFFVDLDCVERALAPAFADRSLDITTFKLVKSTVTDRIVLIVSTQTTDAMPVLKHACDHLRVSHKESLALIINSVRCIPEMPFNSSYKIDLVELQKVADSTEALPPSLSADALEVAPLSQVDVLAEKIATEVKRLSKSPDAIPTDLPLLYSGLTSITMVRLYFWLQSEYEYLEKLEHLFDEDITPQVIASEILSDEEEATEEGTLSPASQAIVVDDEDLDVITLEKDPDYPVEKGDALHPAHGPNHRPKSTIIVMQPPLEAPAPDAGNNVTTHPTLDFSPSSFVFLSWMSPLLRLGSKRPLLESVVIFVSG